MSRYSRQELFAGIGREGQARLAASRVVVVGCAAGDLAELRNYAWDVLINATPIGSRQSPNETPVPAGLHRPGTVVLDMIYDPIDTRLLRDAQAAGCTIVDGVEMLLAQAAGQFETWTGMEAPLDVMKSTLLYLVQTQEEGQ